MKKLIKVLSLIALISICLVGCENSAKTEGSSTKKENNNGFVALLTDYANIDDKSFNEASYKAISEFTKEYGYKKDFYRASVYNDTKAREETFDKAMKAGADVVVASGFEFNELIYKKQKEYKDSAIIFIDSEPVDEKGNIKTESNVYCILYKEHEVGYLAGYAAVMEGYRKLGFLGGLDIPPVKAFGFGYVQGAEAAAKELKLKPGAVQIVYKYAGGFLPTEQITKDVDKWYKSGTEVVFSCGGGILESVVKAAEKDKTRKIIGVDVDQAYISENIIFSAMKGITNSVKLALEKYHKNGKKWPEECAGKTEYLGIAEDCVGLSATEGSWRMKNFTIDDYNKLYNSMKKNPINISKDKMPKLAYVKCVVQK